VVRKNSRLHRNNILFSFAIFLVQSECHYYQRQIYLLWFCLSLLLKTVFFLL